MSPDAVLVELLARMGAAGPDPVRFSGEELSSWPELAVRELKGQGILVAAPSAQSVVCHGCEEACSLPVHVPLGNPDGAFVVCELRDDVNRVPIPAARLEQWQASWSALTRALARWLAIPYDGSAGTLGPILGVGVLRGLKRSAHLQLRTEGEARLLLSGHEVPLIEVLRFAEDGLRLDASRLRSLVDAPVGPAGGRESKPARKARLQRWIAEEKAANNKAFLKTVASREQISPARLKQILAEDPEPKQRRKA